MKYIAKVEVDNDIIIHGDGCINDLESLYTVLVDKETTEIMIEKDFVDKFFTFQGICDFVEQSTAIAPNVK